MENREIGRTFKLLAQLMEFHGQNEFKVKAVLSAALRMSKYPDKLDGVDKQALSSQAGFSSSIAGKIAELTSSGVLEELESYLEKTPPGIVELLGIRGLGPKKVLSITQQLEIEGPAELYYACNENRLVALKGFGEKSQTDIRALLEFSFKNRGHALFPAAMAQAKTWHQQLESLPFIQKCVITGDLRRACETVEKIEFLVLGDVPSLEIYLSGYSVFSRHEAPSTLFSIHEAGSLPVFFHTTTAKGFALSLLKTTGSLEHLALLPPFAHLALESEREIYTALNLPFVEPEQREGLNECIAGSSTGTQGFIPLIEVLDLRGSIHNHSTYSDGINTLEEMARECMAMGLEYLVICDHSQSAFYAHGLKEDEIVRQHAEIDRLNMAFKPFKIFKGIESDILGDGSLDYPAQILARFDVVVASIHSNLRMSVEKANSRLLAAIKNPFTTILGHPTGRLLLGRAGYPIDHGIIIEACAKHGVCLELNANPSRLDMDWRWISSAVEQGVLIAIDPDAHSIRALHDVKYGVQAARKGGLTRFQCLNAMGLSDFESFLAKRKSARCASEA